jgi:hypothetical protein
VVQPAHSRAIHKSKHRQEVASPRVSARSEYEGAPDQFTDTAIPAETLVDKLQDIELKVNNIVSDQRLRGRS